jgi:Ca2+-binding EF-hand superfamily protein
VYPKEIVAYYNYLQAPMLASIRAMAVQEANALFQTLDQTGDGRLSLREMRSAAERLRTLDANGDGRLGEDEIPTTILVTLARGGFSGYSGGTGTLGRQPGGRAPAAAQGPDWFVRMDRNGDGDVTLKEFLGTEEQFRKLDRNGDGFIDRTEAEAAGKP